MVGMETTCQVPHSATYMPAMGIDDNLRTRMGCQNNWRIKFPFFFNINQIRVFWEACMCEGAGDITYAYSVDEGCLLDTYGTSGNAGNWYRLAISGGFYQWGGGANNLVPAKVDGSLDGTHAMFVPPRQMACRHSGYAADPWVSKGTVAVSAAGVFQCAMKCWAAGSQYFGLDCPKTTGVTCRCRNELLDDTEAAIGSCEGQNRSATCNHATAKVVIPNTIPGATEKYYALGGANFASVYYSWYARTATPSPVQQEMPIKCLRVYRNTAATRRRSHNWFSAFELQVLITYYHMDV